MFDDPKPVKVEFFGHCFAVGFVDLLDYGTSYRSAKQDPNAFTIADRMRLAQIDLNTFVSIGMTVRGLETATKAYASKDAKVLLQKFAGDSSAEQVNTYGEQFKDQITSQQDTNRVAMVMIGENDFGSYTDDQKIQENGVTTYKGAVNFQANLTKSIQHLIASGIAPDKIVFCVMPVPPEKNVNGQTSRIYLPKPELEYTVTLPNGEEETREGFVTPAGWKQMREDAITVCRNNGVKCLEVPETFNQYRSSEQSDGLHLTSVGNRAFVSYAIEQVLTMTGNATHPLIAAVGTILVMYQKRINKQERTALLLVNEAIFVDGVQSVEEKALFEHLVAKYILEKGKTLDELFKAMETDDTTKTLAAAAKIDTNKLEEGMGGR